MEHPRYLPVVRQAKCWPKKLTPMVTWCGWTRPQAKKALKVRKGRRDCLVLTAQLGRQAHKVQKAIQVTPGLKAFRVHRAYKVTPERPARQDHKAHKASRGHKATLALRALRALRAQQAYKARRD